MALFLPADTPRRMALLPRDAQRNMICEAIYAKLTTLGLTPPPARTPYVLLDPPDDPANIEGWDAPYRSFMQWIDSIGAGDAADIEVCYKVLSTVGYVHRESGGPNEIKAPGKWTGVQTAVPEPSPGAAVLSVEAGNYQTTALTADAVLTVSGIPIPGTFYRLEVVPGGHTLTVPIGIDPLSRFTQPVGVTRFVIGLDTLSDGSIRYAGVI